MILAISSSLVVWALFSRKLESLNISAAMAFVLAGLVLASWPAAVIDIQVGGEMLRSIAEVTLALLLFSDAARVNVGVLRQDRRVPMRLLMLGLPLTLGLGVALAVWLFPDLNPWAAAAIAAAVAPTDAALGAQVVEDTHVPLRIRRILNVESGLNDGIATPFVSFFVAGAVADTASQSSVTLGGAIADLAIGVLTGIAIGLGGGILLRYVRRLGWSSDSYRGIGVLALALVAYSASIQFGGNGFIGAFVGGLAFGSALPSVKEQDVTLGFDAQSGGFLSLVVWFLFGAAMLPALEAVTWRTVLFVVLALTVVRMVPVAIALRRIRPHPHHHRLRGLVRATWPGVGRVRRARLRFARRARCHAGPRGGHPDRARQRGRPRIQRGAVVASFRPVRRRTSRRCRRATGRSRVHVALAWGPTSTGRSGRVPTPLRTLNRSGRVGQAE